MHKGIVTLLYWLKDLITWWPISPFTRMSVRPSIHQPHCLRRLFPEIEFSATDNKTFFPKTKLYEIEQFFLHF